MAGKRQALGKGLNALLTDATTDVSGRNPVPINAVAEIDINDIEANPFQPREKFDENELEELVDSIKMHGVIQPVTVRKIGYGKYQLISGERRTRASIRAGLKKIPAYVRVADDQAMLEMSLIENIHREDLNSIEIAISYKRLIEECNLIQEDVAKRIGKNRTTVTNYLRLLKLPEEVQLALKDKKISMGHARSIINIDDKGRQIDILNKIIEHELSVRETEELAKDFKEFEEDKKDNQKFRSKQENQFKNWEHHLSEIYGTKVKIRDKKEGKGEIIISFNSEDELKKITSLIKEAQSAE